MTKHKGMIRIKKFKLEEVLPHIGQPGRVPFPRANPDEKPCHVRVDGARMRLISRTQFCAACLIRGRYFWLERSGCWNPHFNLYANNQFGAETMMTMDHIIPKSKGGPTSDDNLQLLCYNCNKSKQDKLLTIKGIMQNRFRGGGENLYNHIHNIAMKHFPEHVERIREAFKDRGRPAECFRLPPSEKSISPSESSASVQC